MQAGWWDGSARGVGERGAGEACRRVAHVCVLAQVCVCSVLASYSMLTRGPAFVSWCGMFAVFLRCPVLAYVLCVLWCCVWSRSAQIFGEPFHEYTHAEEGEAVMGKEYEGELIMMDACFACRVHVRTEEGRKRHASAVCRWPTMETLDLEWARASGSWLWALGMLADCGLLSSCVQIAKPRAGCALSRESSS